MNWLWYTISVTFLLIGCMSLILLIILLKRRAQNGFWSRENHIHDFHSAHTRKLGNNSHGTGAHHPHNNHHRHLKRPLQSRSQRFVSLLSCAKAHTNEDDLIDSHKSNFNLELKTCHLRNHQDRFVTTAPGILHFDEYSTNSLYGTIDRLIVKKANNSNNINTNTVTTNLNSNIYASTTNSSSLNNNSNSNNNNSNNHHHNHHGSNSTSNNHHNHHNHNHSNHHQHGQAPLPHQSPLQLQAASCSSGIYANNYNSITKDPKMIPSTQKSYVMATAAAAAATDNHGDDLLEKNEIHF